MTMTVSDAERAGAPSSSARGAAPAALLEPPVAARALRAASRVSGEGLASEGLANAASETTISTASRATRAKESMAGAFLSRSNSSVSLRHAE